MTIEIKQRIKELEQKLEQLKEYLCVLLYQEDWLEDSVPYLEASM